MFDNSRDIFDDMGVDEPVVGSSQTLEEMIDEASEELARILDERDALLGTLSGRTCGGWGVEA